jgi:hypothetical protein
VDAYYERQPDGRFIAGDATSGPWDVRFQHAGPPAALIARIVDERTPDDGMHIGRITLEIFGPIPKADLEIVTRVVRPGKRVKLVEARLLSEGREAVLGHVWRFGRSTSAPGPLPERAPRALPPVPPPPPVDQATLGRNSGYMASVEWRFASGGYGRYGPADVWCRPNVQLIAGEPTQPRDGLLAIADSANGVSLELPLEAWLSIPSSVTITLAREPAGEWFFLGAETLVGPDGRGVTTGTLGDEAGVVGNIVQALLVAPR